MNQTAQLKYRCGADSQMACSRSPCLQPWRPSNSTVMIETSKVWQTPSSRSLFFRPKTRVQSPYVQNTSTKIMMRTRKPNHQGLMVQIRHSQVPFENSWKKRSMTGKCETSQNSDFFFILNKQLDGHNMMASKR